MDENIPGDIVVALNQVGGIGLEGDIAAVSRYIRVVAGSVGLGA